MYIKEITSPTNDTIKDVRALSMRKRRKETGLFVAEGLRTAIEAMELNAPMTMLIYHTDQKDRIDVKTVRDYCAKQNGLICEVNDTVLEKLSTKDNPQRVIGVYKQIWQDKHIIKDGCWVALDQVRDPGNLGTIIRTVDAVGARGVILIDHCCDPFSPESVQASMGSIFSVPLVHMTADEFIPWAKDTWRGKIDGDIIGTILQTTKNAQEQDYKANSILLMGNEQAGISDELRNVCTTLVKLPMRGRADSLNLSIATGVMLYELIK
jgi:RNA methyltransferase, TrmH family